MGCSWFSYSGTLEFTDTGFILIPEYAQDWVGADRLEIVQSDDYASFEIKRPDGNTKSRKTWINGHVLIGAFMHLEYGDVDVSFNRCLYDDDHEKTYDKEDVEELRVDGIFSNASDYEKPYSLKIVEMDDTDTTYEDCPFFSPCGQTGYHAAYLDDDDEDDQFIKDQYRYGGDVWKAYFR